MSTQRIAEEAVAPAGQPPGPARLHRPWRSLVALGELAGAALAILLAFWCWDRGIVPVVTLLEDGTRLESTRHVGHWLAAAIGLGAVAAVLVLDALRQVLLAVRVRPRRESIAGRHAAVPG